MKISCPGKIILMGEHAVVYGKPAIVAAVDRRMTVIFNEKNQTSEIKSDIPIGCGMGSSAAWSVVLAASKIFFEQSEKFADGSRLSAKILSRINQMAYEQEKINHGNPSGIDNTICTYGGVLWYKKLKSGKKFFKKIKTKKLPQFILVNTGKPTESTKEMVEMVKEKLLKEKNKTNRIFDCIEEQTKLFLKALTERMAKEKRINLIKNCIQNCESCLEDLGVVSLYVKKIVSEVKKIGGCAKICGGGGITKATGILLCYHQQPEKILELGKKLGLECFQVKFGVEGVRIKIRIRINKT